MATLARDLLAKLRRPTDGEPQVHFHQGPDHAPVVCHDEGCAQPRLDV